MSRSSSELVADCLHTQQHLDLLSSQVKDVKKLPLRVAWKI